MAPELAGKMTAKAAVAAAAKPSPPTKAFVTFLAGDGDYWMGVVGWPRACARRARPTRS